MGIGEGRQPKESGVPGLGETDERLRQPFHMTGDYGRADGDAVEEAAQHHEGRGVEAEKTCLERRFVLALVASEERIGAAQDHPFDRLLRQGRRLRWIAKGRLRGRRESRERVARDLRRNRHFRDAAAREERAELGRRLVDRPRRTEELTADEDSIVDERDADFPACPRREVGENSVRLLTFTSR